MTRPPDLARRGEPDPAGRNREAARGGTANVEPGDDALLAALRHGDREALAELVRRYQAPLYRAALQVVHDPADAQDVVQDTFLRVFRGVAGFRGQGSVRGWLYRIAVNLAVDAVRSRRRRAAQPLDDGDVPGGADPLAAALAAERAEAVRAAVAELPLHYRLPVILREWHGLSYEEVADALGIPVGTVRSRLHAGRELLRRRLDAVWRGGGDRP